jgi:hypothetical protein
MVWQDYELVHTKRVNRERVGTDPFKYRLFQAAGGYATWYHSFLFAAVGYYLGGISKQELIPTKEFLTKAGALKYASRAGLWVLLPMYLGRKYGMSINGNPSEFYNLKSYAGVYK